MWGLPAQQEVPSGRLALLTSPHTLLSYIPLSSELAVRSYLIHTHPSPVHMYPFFLLSTPICCLVIPSAPGWTLDTLEVTPDLGLP